VHCTTILERSVDGFIFDTGGKSTQLIIRLNGPFHCVYTGGSYDERYDTREGREKGAESSFVATKQNKMVELKFGRKGASGAPWIERG
jgi:hypothetical protein